MRDWLGLPMAAAADAGVIDRELVLVHWLMLALFAGWSAFFVYALVRFRASRQPVAAGTRLRRRWLVFGAGGVLIAEIALLSFFSLPAWSARVDAFPAERESTVVRVVAEQFAWNVHYPGDDAQFGRTRVELVSTDNPLGLDRADPAARDDVTTVNQLHLPVNRPAIVYVTSKDVVHSFTLPQMRVKQDAIPGTVQPVWFRPTVIGSWEIACSQLCGLAHYRMKGFYTIETEAAFQSWLAGEARLAAAP